MEEKKQGPEAHLQKLEEELKKEPVSDELLRNHIRKLRKAWHPEVVPNAAVA